MTRLRTILLAGAVLAAAALAASPASAATTRCVPGSFSQSRGGPLVVAEQGMILTGGRRFISDIVAQQRVSACSFRNGRVTSFGISQSLQCGPGCDDPDFRSPALRSIGAIAVNGPYFAYAVDNCPAQPPSGPTPCSRRIRVGSLRTGRLVHELDPGPGGVARLVLASRRGDFAYITRVGTGPTAPYEVRKVTRTGTQVLDAGADVEAGSLAIVHSPDVTPEGSSFDTQYVYWHRGGVAKSDAL